jgi:hypothetical protein
MCPAAPLAQRAALRSRAWRPTRDGENRAAALARSRVSFADQTDLLAMTGDADADQASVLLQGGYREEAEAALERALDLPWTWPPSLMFPALMSASTTASTETRASPSTATSHFICPWMTSDPADTKVPSIRARRAITEAFESMVMSVKGSGPSLSALRPFDDLTRTLSLSGRAAAAMNHAVE